MIATGGAGTRAGASAARQVVEVTAGPVEYEDTGGEGPVLVLLHGLVMDSRVWDEVVAGLGSGFRCVRPTLPFGAHRRPMRPQADLSLHGVGRIVAEFLEALDLRDVTLVFNDWGGAAVMIDDGLMDRVARLVLTPCEAFENYPPGVPGRLAALSARLPGGVLGMRQALRFAPVRRLPVVFGRMSKRGVPDELVREWIEPLRRGEIRRDLAKYAAQAFAGRRAMVAASPALSRFERPVLVAWAPEDRMMRPANGPRLAAAFPAARLEQVEGSYVLMPIDRPDRLAALLRDFAGG
jgi:pimeloyl-ACP methyl ester carboxylesterase